MFLTSRTPTATVCVHSDVGMGERVVDGGFLTVQETAAATGHKIGTRSGRFLTDIKTACGCPGAK